MPCPCGQSTRPLTRADTPACNFHVTFITDSVKHYHKERTEVYFILPIAATGLAQAELPQPAVALCSRDVGPSAAHRP